MKKKRKQNTVELYKQYMEKCCELGKLQFLLEMSLQDVYSQIHPKICEIKKRIEELKAEME